MKKAPKENFKYEEGEVVKTEIPESPFVVITTSEGSFGTLGKYVLTEIYQDREEAVRVTTKITWNRILQVVSLVNEILKTEDKK